jgi:SNF2 family DNA or RNA helicase
VDFGAALAQAGGFQDARYDRYAQPVLAARIDPATGRDIRLRVESADWQTADVAAALRHLTALPKNTKDGSGETKVPLTWAIVTQLASLMEERDFKWKPDPDLNQWIYDEFMRRHDEPAPGCSPDLKFDAQGLDWDPMPHQLAGAYVGAINRRLFLGDEPGCGKTATVLLTLAELESRGVNPFPVFVVAPASVCDQWLEELDERFPVWPATLYAGAKRKNLSSRYKLYVMSWDVMRTDMKHSAGELPPLLDFLKPETVVYDECHILSNARTKQSAAARTLARAADNALLLSGTPITKDIGGFWSALAVLDVRSFPNEERFKERYCDRISKEYGQPEVTGLLPANQKEFFTLVQGSMRRVAKEDVLTDLPPKTYQTRVVKLPPAYRAAYEEMKKDMIAHLPDSPDEPLEVMSTLAQLQRLTQLASSACDVEVEMVLEEREDHPLFGELVPKTHVYPREPSWKIDELMAILDGSQGSPLITFSPHTSLVNLAGKRAASHGYRVGYITGEQSKVKKTLTRKAFQRGEIDLLCCNTAAGGVGLNLTAASTMVFLERSFAFWQADQNEGRIHRRGQTEQVTIIDIVAENTIESKIRAAMRTKAESLSVLVRDQRIVESFLRDQPIHV